MTASPHHPDLQRLANLNPVPEPAAHIDPTHRDQLVRYVLRAPQTPVHTSRWRTARPAGGLLAVACLTVGILSLTLQSERNTIGLPAAARALADEVAGGTITHTIATGTSGASDASGGPSTVKTETWESSNHVQTRTKITYSDGTFQDLALTREAHRYRVDAYWSKDHRFSRGDWQPLSPNTPDAADMNVADDYAKAINDGKARVVGQTTVDNQPAIKVSPTGDRVAQSIVWTIAKDPAHPRLFSQTICLQGSPCITTSYDVFEKINEAPTLQLPDYPR